MSKPYGKINDAPLTPPDTSVPLAQTQLPENVLWLSGGRGFRKRPGTLPYATLAASVANANHTINLACGLFAVRTPPYLLEPMYLGPTYIETGVVAEPVTLLGQRLFSVVGGVGSVAGGEVFQLRNVRGAKLSDRLYFGRARDSRNNAGYYIQSVLDTANGVSVSDTSSVGDVASLGTGYNDYVQSDLQAYGLAPEQRSLTDFNTLEDTNSNTLYIAAPRGLGPAFTLSGTPQDRPFGLNRFRYDAFSTGSGVFVGGGGTGLQFFDGYRMFGAGAADLYTYNQTVLELLGGGSLTGTYQYMISHYVELPSGEVLEGEPTAPATQIATSNNVRVTLANISGGTVDGTGGDPFTEAFYRVKSFTTNSTGSVLTITVNEPHDINVGEYLTFFVSGARERRRVIQVAGQNLILDSSLTLAGTTYFSCGGGFRLYRTKAGGSVFYRLRDFAWGEVTAPLYTDSTADSALTEEYLDTASRRFEPPTNVFGCAQHQGRTVLLATGASSFFSYFERVNYQSRGALSVWYSSALSNFYFDPANSFPVPIGAFEQPAGIVSLHDTLFIFCSNSIHGVVGQLGTPETFSLHTITDQWGCRDPKSLIRVGNSIFFVSSDGLLELVGNTVSRDVGEPVNKLLLERGTVTASYFWRSKNLLLVSANKMLIKRQNTSTPTEYLPGGDVTSPVFSYVVSEPRTLVYDFSARKWSQWSIDCFGGAVELANGDLVFAPTGDNTEAQYGSVAPLILYRMSDNCNWTDAGEDYMARWYSPWYDAGAPGVDKSFNRVAIFSTDTEEAGGQGFQLTVKTERDWTPGDVLDSTTLTDFRYGQGYGEQPYGTTPYGDVNRPYKVLPLSNQGVKSLRVVLENSEPNGDFCINAVALEVAGKFVNMKDE